MNYEKNYLNFLKCAKPIILTEFVEKLKDQNFGDSDEEKIQKFRQLINNLSDLDAFSLQQLEDTLVAVVKACKEVMEKQKVPKKMTISVSDVKKHEMMYLFYLSRFTIEELHVKIDVDDVALIEKVISMCYCLISAGAVEKVSFGEFPPKLEKTVDDSLKKFVDDSLLNHKFKMAVAKDIEVVVDRTKNQRNEQLVIIFMNFFRGNRKGTMFKKMKVQSRVMTHDCGDLLEIESEKTNAPVYKGEKEKYDPLKLRNAKDRKKQKEPASTATHKKLERLPDSLFDEIRHEKMVAQEKKNLEDLEQVINRMGLSDDTVVASVYQNTKSQYNRSVRESVEYAKTHNPRMNQSSTMKLLIEQRRREISRIPEIKTKEEKKLASHVREYVAAFNKNKKSVVDKLDEDSTVSTVIFYNKFFVDEATKESDVMNSLVWLLDTFPEEENLISFIEELFVMCDMHVSKIEARFDLGSTGKVRSNVSAELITAIVSYITLNEPGLNERRDLEVIMCALRICMSANVEDSRATHVRTIKESTYADIEWFDYTYKDENNGTIKNKEVAAKVYKNPERETGGNIKQDWAYYYWVFNDSFHDMMNDIIFTLSANNFVFTSPTQFEQNVSKYMHCPIHDIVIISDFEKYHPETCIAILMPLMEGDLEKLLETHGESKIPILDRLAIMLQMTTAVEHLNSIGIAHCDIKPSNFVYLDLKYMDIGKGLPFRYLAYTIDFGISQTLEPIKALEDDPDYHPLDFAYYDKIDAGNLALMMVNSNQVPISKYVQESLNQPRQQQQLYVELSSDENMYTNLFRPPELFIFEYYDSSNTYKEEARGYASVVDTKNMAKNLINPHHEMFQSSEVYALLMSLFVMNRTSAPLDYLDIYLYEIVGTHIDSQNTEALPGIDKDKEKNFPKFSSYIFSARQDMFLDIGRQLRNKNIYEAQIEITMLQFFLVHLNMSPNNRPSFSTIKNFFITMMHEVRKLQAEEEALHASMGNLSFSKSNDKKPAAADDDDEDDEKSNTLCTLI